jgi:hypothetical protein
MHCTHPLYSSTVLIHYMHGLHTILIHCTHTLHTLIFSYFVYPFCIILLTIASHYNYSLQVVVLRLLLRLEPAPQGTEMRLTLYSFCTHTALVLYSYCTPTILLLHSHFTPTVLSCILNPLLLNPIPLNPLPFKPVSIQHEGTSESTALKCSSN